MSMSLPTMHPIAASGLAFLIAAPFTECFTHDEQAIIGAFFTTLGDVISLNSAYASYLQSRCDPPEEENQKDNSDEFDLLKKSLEKLQVEIQKMKDNKH